MRLSRALIVFTVTAVLAACGASSHSAYTPTVLDYSRVRALDAFSPPPWGQSAYASPGPGVYQICNRVVYYPAKITNCGTNTVQAKAFAKAASAVATPCGSAPGSCAFSTAITAKMGAPLITAAASVTPGPHDGQPTEAMQNLSLYWRDAMTVNSSTLPPGSPATVRITETVTVNSFNAPCEDAITGNDQLSIAASSLLYSGTSSMSANIWGNCSATGFFEWAGGLMTTYTDMPVTVGAVYMAAGSLQIGLDASDSGNYTPADMTSSVTGALSTTHFTSETPGVTLSYSSGKLRY